MSVRTWYPFRSEESKQITAHLSDDEVREFERVVNEFGKGYGLATGILWHFPDQFSQLQRCKQVGTGP